VPAADATAQRQQVMTDDADQKAVALFTTEQKPQADTAQLQPASVGVAAAPVSSFGTLASGFYLQLGSYSQAANAEAARSRLMQSWATGLPPLETAENGGFYRLYSGPYASRAEAAAAAQVLKGRGPSRPIVVRR
jgi:rare lipoprotein A